MEDATSKRGCGRRDKSTECPLARFGCVQELSYDDLIEHYGSRRHQDVLMKAVEKYVRDLHDIPQGRMNNDDYVELSDSLTILAEGLSCLTDDNVEIQKNLKQLSDYLIHNQRKVDELKESSRTTTQLVQSTQMNYDFLQTEIEAIKQRSVNVQNSSSKDGTYIWKITGMAEKIAAAISDQQTSIYSPPFYSSPNGYKMCMRLYPHGDGQARRTHLSLFFVLMRGDYDPILVWPFQYKITFILLDQSGAQQHIVDSFRPDIKSNSFQRPTSDMNIASGLPKFTSLSLIQAENNPYIRDNCMFIRCIVDFTSIPKPCLPFMANINPGLPLPVQHEQIQTEVKKYKSSTSESSEKMDASK